MRIINFQFILKFKCALVFLMLFNFSFSQSEIITIDNAGKIHIVNVNTCSSTLVGPTNNIIYDIAYTPNSDKLYGITGFGEIYLISQQDASLTYVGNFSQPAGSTTFFPLYTYNSLTANVNGLLYTAYRDYNASTGGIRTFNLETGVETFLGNLPGNNSPAGDITFSDGELYLTSTNDELVRVDLADLSNTNVVGAYSNLTNVFGVVSVFEQASCSNVFYATSATGVHAVDLINLSTTTTCAVVTTGVIYGAASKTEVIDDPQILGDNSVCELAQPVALNGLPAGGTWSSNCGSCLDNNGVFTPNAGDAGNYTLGYGICGVVASKNFQVINCVLPVELAAFNVEKVDNSYSKISWSTMSEKDNAYFIIEKTTDMFTWKELGRVEGVGNTAGKTDYSINDYKPNLGVNYYRLKQVDFDGEESYSDIKSLNYDNINGTIKIVPNPNNGIFSVSLNATGYDNAVLRLTDVYGKQVAVQIDVNQSQFNMSSLLRSGVYIAEIISNNEVIEVTKMVVK